MNQLLSLPQKKALTPGADTPEETVPMLRRLFWLYFILLVFEGALRKWILPSLSGPLLLIRDPVAVAIYVCAWQRGLKVPGGHFRSLMALTAAGVLLFVLQLLTLNLPSSVLLYGLRSNFLHLPLIFIVPLAFAQADLHKLGRWVLLLAIPLSLLMTAQFEASPQAWLNRVPGVVDGQQLPSALGRIRPPATFSFITGVVSYFSLVTAFFLYGLKAHPQRYSAGLLFGGSSAILLALVVSGSRAFVLSTLIIAVVWVLGLTSMGRSQSQFSRLFLFLALTLAFLNQIEVFNEGSRVLSVRWESASQSEAPEGGLAGRIFRSLVSPIQALTQAPLSGIGLGVGTNVGARLLTGQRQFLLSEEEWARLVLEMGPLVGLAFILWRLTLAAWLAHGAIRAAAQGHILPLLLFGSCASHLLTGQLHQSTTQGFTALLTGLCYAAIRATSPTPESVRVRSFRRFTTRALATG